MTEHHGPEITPQQVQGTTRKASSSGNVEYGEPVILSETSRSKVIARPWYIPHSDRTRLSLKIQTLRKADPPNSWIEVEEKSITLREDATEKLVAELPKFAAVAQQESTGDYLIVKLTDGTAEISNLDPEAVVAGLLSALSQEGITEHLNGAELGPELAKALRHSVRLTEMKQAMLELRTLLESGQNQERFYQGWCESHPWAFGNQFVVNDTIRNISIQDQVDLLMPRIMAGFRDIIELKRPNVEVLNYDATHRDYYFSSEVSKAIGQCHRYLDVFVEEAGKGLRGNPEIIAYHPEATIVIGRMADWGDEKAKALHGLNSRLSGIRVITYDHLLAQGESLIDYLSAEPGAQEEPDFPEYVPNNSPSTGSFDDEMPF